MLRDVGIKNFHEGINRDTVLVGIVTVPRTDIIFTVPRIAIKCKIFFGCLHSVCKGDREMLYYAEQSEQTSNRHYGMEVGMLPGLPDRPARKPRTRNAGPRVVFPFSLPIALYEQLDAVAYMYHLAKSDVARAALAHYFLGLDTKAIAPDAHTSETKGEKEEIPA